jgi:Ca2+:H+ antiporter
MLTLVAIALILPAAFQAAPGAKTTDRLDALSVSISIVLLLVCLLYLAFALIIYSALFAGSYAPGKAEVAFERAATYSSTAPAQRFK